jgi:general secretion pathway protein J
VNRPRRHARAFTLLELLVATAMMAVLAGSLYATLHVAFRARRSAFAAVEDVRKADLAVELLRSDLESSVVPRGILAGAFVGEDSTDGAGRPSDVLMLHCTADAGQETEGFGDIRMVEFACEPAEDGEGMILLRLVTLNLLTTNVLEPEEEVLCRGLRSFNLRYFDGEEWLDNWDAAVEDNVLPLAMEVTLELVGEDDTVADGTGYWVSRVFQLPCSSLLPGQQVEMSPL